MSMSMGTEMRFMCWSLRLHNHSWLPNLTDFCNCYHQSGLAHWLWHLIFSHREGGCFRNLLMRLMMLTIILMMTILIVLIITSERPCALTHRWNILRVTVTLDSSSTEFPYHGILTLQEYMEYIESSQGYITPGCVFSHTFLEYVKPKY